MAIYNGYSSMAYDSIAPHIEEDETIQEITIGKTKGTQMVGILLGPIAEAIAGRGNKDFIIALTDRRLVLAKWKWIGGIKEIGEVQGIPLAEVKGMMYKSEISAGTLSIHLSDTELEFKFEKRPWYPRAQKLAKLMPLSE